MTQNSFSITWTVVQKKKSRNSSLQYTKARKKRPTKFPIQEPRSRPNAVRILSTIRNCTKITINQNNIHTSHHFTTLNGHSLINSPFGSLNTICQGQLIDFDLQAFGLIILCSTARQPTQRRCRRCRSHPSEDDGDSGRLAPQGGRMLFLGLWWGGPLISWSKW